MKPSYDAKFLGHVFCIVFAILPYTAVAANVGIADVMSSLYVQKKTDGCYSLHAGEDFIYLSPSTTGGAWSQVTNGSNLVEKYKVLTGDTVRVTYKNSASSGRRRLLSDPPPALDGIEVLAATEGHEIYTGAQVRVKSIIYIITTCGWNASTTVNETANLFFNGSMTISGYHDTCTYGKVAYDQSENVIFGPVDVPCNGTVYNGVLAYPFNGATSCGAAEQFAWRQYAEAAARNVKCPWAGLGSVGCGGSACTVYIKGTYAKSLTVNMHELGHTQGLSHAGQGLDEYGDVTDVMGTARSEGYLCMNVGNQYRVGWNAPLAVLVPANTSTAIGNANQKGRWVLPATSLNDTNALYLNYYSPSAPFPNMFVSYRVRQSKYDNALPTTNSRKVYVHQFNGTASDRDYNRTLLVAMLGVNNTYTSPFLDRNNDYNVGGGVKVTVLSLGATSATVQLCRFTQLVESGADACTDGIDNDCDGLVDGADPSCQVPPSPPPPPSPPTMPV